MPTITIQMWEGRTPEVKADLAKTVTRLISEKLSVPEESVTVVFSELSKTNFARGGVLASDRGK
ncbi:MAG TPA: 2-hydroxymuconate tautomerase [Candidatus Hodarchaeales archaeon]|nr:2-hydroxymuconate tautomerase [Candidatus Hodarchaeales archaeon]